MLISHILGEVLRNCDRIVVMRDGKVGRSRTRRANFDRARLIAAMGGVDGQAPRGDGAGARRPREAPVARARPAAPAGATVARCVAHEGEIIGLAGPRRPRPDRSAARRFRRRGAGAARAEVDGPVALVAGDRQSDGVFPQWSIAENIGVRSLAAPAARPADLAGARATRSPNAWRERIGIRTPDIDNNILSLSGGNQQKALFARALGSDAAIVLMDDPMRGVDYRHQARGLRPDPRGGRSGADLLWYTTETDELQNCDRAYVFRNGAIVARARARRTDRGARHPFLLRRGRAEMTAPPQLAARPAPRQRPIAALLARRAAGAVAGARRRGDRLAQSARDQLFRLHADAESRDSDRARDDGADVRDRRQRPRSLASAPSSASSAASRRPGCSDAPLLGVVVLLGCIAVYAPLGALIYLRNLPSIVVTLGHELRLAGPRRSCCCRSPAARRRSWLQALMGVKPPFVPFPILAALVIAAVGYFGLMRTSYGAILRGVGRQRGRDRRAPAGRCSGPRRRCSRLPACSACCRAWRWSASPPRPTPISATATPCFRSPASSSAAANSSAAACRRSARCIGALTLAMAASPLLDLHAHPARLAGRRPTARSSIIVLAARVLISRRGASAMIGAVHGARRRPWIWSFVGALLVWLAAIAIHRRLWRGRHADGGAVAGGVHRHRRRRRRCSSSRSGRAMSTCRCPPISGSPARSR